MSHVIIRPAAPEDTPVMFRVFLRSINVYLLHRRVKPMADPDDPAAVAEEWAEERSMLEHIAASADQSWVAECEGEVVGYARSFLRETVRQLTEFFVDPAAQSGGVGRELLARAFAAEGTTNRVVIATGDARALARYLRSGVVPQFPMCFFVQKTPVAQTYETDLAIDPMPPTDAVLESLAEIDQVVIGFRRDVDHRWYAQDEDRVGYLVRRGSHVVGYGYFGKRNGPVALLDPADFPAVLTFGETLAARNGHAFDLPVPLINRAAIDHLLRRGSRLEVDFMTFIMMAEPMGRYDRYILTSPEFFI